MPDSHRPGVRLLDSELTLPTQKSAGLAWLLSMIVPGAGHFYCGTKVRGGLVLGFSLAGLLVAGSSLVGAARGEALGGLMLGSAFLAVPALYVFGFLDAYFTAQEINRGIDPTLVDGPRVAAALNLLTNGIGYFYLGERVKGLAVFVGVGMAMRVVGLLVAGNPVLTGLASLAGILLVAALTLDAYRIGRRSFNEQVAGMELRTDVAPSRLPAAIPLAIGGLITALVLTAVLAGSVAVMFGAGRGPVS